jgi:hypothetical protein
MRRTNNPLPPITPKCDKARRAVAANRKHEAAAHIDPIEALVLFHHQTPRGRMVVQSKFGCWHARATAVVTQLLAAGLLREHRSAGGKFLLTEAGMERLGRSVV